MSDTASPFQRAPQAPPLPRGAMSFVLWFVARYRWWYVAMFAFETAQATCGILIPYAINLLVRGVTQSAGAAPALVGALERPLMWFVVLSVGEVVFSRTAGSLQFHIGPIQRQAVTRDLFAYLQHHSHRFFTNNFAGALAHRVSETSVGVNQTLWMLLFDFWPVVIVLSVSVVLLGHAHTQLAWFVGLWAVVFVALSYRLAMRCQPHTIRAAAARSETTGKIVDTVSNSMSARLFARLEFERHQLDHALNHELEFVRQSVRYSDRVRWFNYIAAAVLKIGVLVYSVRLWERGAIGVGDFVMAVSLSLLIINEARNLSRRFLELFEYMGNVANGVQTIVRSHELIDQPQVGTTAAGGGDIVMHDVCFAYVPGQPVFDKLSVTIPAGQRVGLVGLSGSGKSTFVSLLLRMYDLQSGRISIGGADIASLTQDALHEQIGLIPQDPTLFHRALIDNIRYGRLGASDAEVIEAAKLAHAHDFIAAMSEGYRSMVGERGVKLSGGQRQRIAIARVILKNAPVLVLDEATSSLDSITERAIQDTLDRVMHGKTVIVVAHRLSTISHLDRILVFDAGRVVEDGSHAELLALRGAYWRLWSKQADGFLPEHVADVEKGVEVISDDAIEYPSADHDDDARPARQDHEPGVSRAGARRAGEGTNSTSRR